MAKNNIENLVHVKNADGDKDTTAVVLIQNKIDYTPKVSVIIPVYNVEKYLRQCLDSVIGQTLKEIEIICVDDGSTDNSLEILKEYAARDNRITVLSQQNLHAGVARNAGLAVARGEYLHFLDSDDWVEEDIYANVMSDISKNDIDVYLLNFNDYDNVTHEINLRTPYTEYKKLFRFEEDASVLKRPVVPWNKIYKRSFVEDNKLKFDATLVANDRTFYFKVMFANPLIQKTSFDKAFINYRINNVNSLVGEKRLNNFENHFTSFERSVEVCLKTWPDQVNIIIDLFMLDCIYFYNKANDRQKDLLLDTLYDYFTKEDFLKKYNLTGYSWYDFYKFALRKKRIIPVVFATNDLYAKFVPVTMYSIMKNADKSDTYRFYVFHSGLTDESKKQITCIYNVLAGDYRIEFVNVKEKIDDSIYARGRFSIEMWYRIFIPEILDQYEKVLYLDCDMIVCKNLAELYNTDIEDCYLGACRNYVTNRYNRLVALGIEPDSYFNSGMLLFNNKKWNKLKLREKCFEKASQHPGLECPDQDILNIVCKDNVKFIDVKWNLLWQFLCIPDLKLSGNDLLEYKKAQKDLCIVHYTTAIKPWKNIGYKYANLWWKSAIPTGLFSYEEAKRLQKSTGRSSVKPYVLFPYYLLASLWIGGVKIPLLKFVKHMKKVIYSHSTRGRIEKLKRNIFEYIENTAKNTNGNIAAIKEKIDIVKNEFDKIKETVEDTIEKNAGVTNDLIAVNRQLLEAVGVFYTFDKQTNWAKSHHMTEIASVPDFEQRFMNLIKNMPLESVETVITIIRRLQIIKDGKHHDLFTTEEKNALARVKQFENSVLKLADDKFVCGNYYLPINHFEPSVFLYKHGLDKLGDLESLKDKAILDIGGFVGDSALVLSPLTRDKVYSFEGFGKNYDYLIKSIEMNNLRNVVPVKCVVGDKDGEVEMWYQGGGTSIDRDMAKGATVSEKVKMIKIDDYVREHNIKVGLIKVDIEGAEQAFLRGAKETISEQKPTLLISIYHNVDDFLDIKPMIESWNLGYKFKIFKPTIGSVSAETLLICEQ